MKFISTKNILNKNIFQISDIFYLLRDRDFYLKLVEVLRRKKMFDYTVWSYSLVHSDHESLREFMSCSQNEALFSKLMYFSSSLLEVRNVRVLEYYPFISSRVHQMSQNKILNKQFK